ncbi:hypothetical protein E5288_WYG021602 [Bos mutus]|uniref:KRAB domain-containing protein n=1 Tax=Bos mutus TaxID=72004 RepID=A0A6B0S3I5_9CETA|nr:hypothetical protein [Bos mutus]
MLLPTLTFNYLFTFLSTLPVLSTAKSYQISKSDVVFQLEQGKELWTQAAGGLQGQSPGSESLFRQQEITLMQSVYWKHTSPIRTMVRFMGEKPRQQLNDLVMR